MVLVDTNVFVSLLIDGPFSAPACALFERDPDWRSESFALVELCNVLATVMRVRDLRLPDAQAIYRRATALLGRSLVIVENEASVALAHAHKVTAYDARFLAAAQYLGVPLVTEDARLRSAAPASTRSIAEALGA